MYMGKVSLSRALSFSLVCANMNTLIVSFAIFYICVVLYRCPLFLSLSFSLSLSLPTSQALSR